MGLLFLGGNVDHWLELGLAFLSSNSLAVLAAALISAPLHVDLSKNLLDDEILARVRDLYSEDFEMYEGIG